eukprot:CAMPEP_0169106320 /NCGR_PEP_ID=MMETSP1015-20121227/24273_1 /TAXON_ID=342587 /ORGANISM="Karlodinium micrum, Strain CCMP2283" /LENGTH=143 /DNA_ID=CAMNT_0009167751 /DNA_START=369 /DNA_END=800 /DNA_ORIENTATION=+
MATGLVHWLFGDGYLWGFSGGVFALIMLNASIGLKNKAVPITTVIIVWFWVIKEVWPLYYNRSTDDARTSHVVGALVGAVCAHAIVARGALSTWYRSLGAFLRGGLTKPSPKEHSHGKGKNKETDGGSSGKEEPSPKKRRISN